MRQLTVVLKDKKQARLPKSDMQVTQRSENGYLSSGTVSFPKSEKSDYLSQLFESVCREGTGDLQGGINMHRAALIVDVTDASDKPAMKELLLAIRNGVQKNWNLSSMVLKISDRTLLHCRV